MDGNEAEATKKARRRVILVGRAKIGLDHDKRLVAQSANIIQRKGASVRAELVLEHANGNGNGYARAGSGGGLQNALLIERGSRGLLSCPHGRSRSSSTSRHATRPQPAHLSLALVDISIRQRSFLKAAAIIIEYETSRMEGIVGVAAS